MGVYLCGEINAQERVYVFTYEVNIYIYVCVSMRIYVFLQMCVFVCI